MFLKTSGSSLLLELEQINGCNPEIGLKMLGKHLITPSPPLPFPFLLQTLTNMPTIKSGVI